MQEMGNDMRAFTLLFALNLLIPIAAVGQEDIVCNGPYKGKTPTNEMLKQVREQHYDWASDFNGDAQPSFGIFEKWLSDYNYEKYLSDLKAYRNKASNDPRRANLCKAYLSEVDLTWALLVGADLSGATLSEANLEGANLLVANLGGADLSGAYLSGALLDEADLSEANLDGANLSGAYLEGADLSEANLGDAKLVNADVTGAIFSVKPLSDVIGLRGISGLSDIRIVEVSPIVDLRKQFKEAGFKSEEKALTSALRKSELKQASIPERIFTRYLMGGLLTDFGADPSLAVIILVSLIPLFACFYFFAVWNPGNDGIWQRWIDGRSRSDLGSDQPVLVKKRGFSAAGYALYFSLLSAFHIGWRELNVGNWISRIQPREYTLSGSGWVRTVSGIQSLLSVYLLAMAALSYFGRPFE